MGNRFDIREYHTATGATFPSHVVDGMICVGTVAIGDDYDAESADLLMLTPLQAERLVSSLSRSLARISTK